MRADEAEAKARFEAAQARLDEAIAELEEARQVWRDTPTVAYGRVVQHVGNGKWEVVK